MLPGGVNSPVRAMRAIGRDPIFIERASGAELTDVDGNVYVDYVCSWGPLIHGHAHPAILEAVTDGGGARHVLRRARRRARSSSPRRSRARMPSVDMLRMTSSGHRGDDERDPARPRRDRPRRSSSSSPAPTTGTSTGCSPQAGSGLATQGIPSSPGVPGGGGRADRSSCRGTTPRRCARAFAEHEFAAVLVEPYPANMGLIPPAPGFLELLRDLCTGYDALLIFDEVITGFRVAPGGAQELTGVLPGPDRDGQDPRRRAARPRRSAARRR